jgi:thiamine pyrophosphate-dependent acetolactate synthase large subunit-like protein
VPPAARTILADADVVLALDWPDLAHTLAGVYGTRRVTAKVIRVSCDAHSHRGWSLDHQALPPSDLYMMCEADAAVRSLLETTRPRAVAEARPSAEPTPPLTEALSSDHIFAVLETAAQGMDLCFTRVPFSWSGAHAPFRHPLDYIGYDGGSGIGSGPGITVGAGLALQGSGRIPTGVMGDGDFIMGNTAVWTAAHYGIACLMIVCNNRSFHADESHQRRVAEVRSRPQENRWIGARIEDPAVDLAQLSAAQGAVGIGPVTELSELERAIEQGIDAARTGKVCVIDVHVSREDDPAPSRRPMRLRAKRLVRRLESRLAPRVRRGSQPPTS